MHSQASETMGDCCGSPRTGHLHGDNAMWYHQRLPESAGFAASHIE